MKGAHVLRHSLATDLLRRGASLADIGDVLRHQQPNTTEIYAKVDVTRPRLLAPAAAGRRCTMTALRRAINDYLTLRRRLGGTLHEAGRVLIAFAAYAERERAEHATTDLVLRWATQLAGIAGATVNRRCQIIGRFAIRTS
jgi:integrase-like protein